jgi:hypothetical protein
VTPSATARLHTTATHAVPSTTETPEHHFAAVKNIITPEDGRIRPKHVESYNTCNKAIHLCIKLDIHLPYVCLASWREDVLIKRMSFAGINSHEGAEKNDNKFFIGKYEAKN